MKLLLLLLLLLIPASTQAADWYVRTDGASSPTCNGHFDAPAASSPNCAFSNPQAAYNAATFGDTIKLKAGQTFATAANPFSEWSLPNKGTPPTGTDADYITITTTDPSLTPAALSNYPAIPTRITSALAAGMPHVVCNGSTPIFRIKNGAKYWKIERLDIRNDGSNGYQTIRFFDTEDGISSLAAVPDHIVIQYNWIHPDEETGTVLSSSNVNRSAENAIYLTATNFIIQNNAIQGFAGRVRYGGEAGQVMTSAAILVSTYGDTGIIRNNLIEAWTYGFFAGGSSMPDWAVTEGGTVTSCASATVCTFDNVAGLQVGEPLSLRVNSVATWGATFVQGIAGNTVTFTAPLCHSYDGNNSCTGIPGNPTPVAGDKVRWDGLAPNNIQLTRNIFAHYPEWTSLLGQCGGKGYLEMKACTDCVFTGNVFAGCTGMTVTVRNQSGDFAWASLDGLSFISNYFTGSNNTFVGFLRDSSPTPRTQNVTWHNNLMVGLNANVTFNPGGTLSGNFGGGQNLTITHNTVAWSKTNQPGMSLSAYRNFISFTTINGTYNNSVLGLTIQDNIFPLGPNQCFGGNGTMSQCWISPTVTNNVLVNADGWSNEEVNNSWRTLYPGNSFTSSYASVGFVNPDANLTAAGNYQLLPTSPYKGTGTGGSDPGVNFSELVTALGFDPFGVAGAARVSGKVIVSGKATITP